MLRQKWLRFLREKAGNTTIIFALSLPALVGFAGLSVDASYWYMRQRQVQSAADIAAYAGAVSIRNNESAYQAETEATGEAARHGYDPGRGSIDVNSPPLAGGFISNRSVEVIVSQTEPRFFSAMFSEEPVVLTARAVASYTEPQNACVLALDHDEAGAMEFFGSSNVSLINCEVMSNSIASNAFEISGSADLETPCVNAVGGVYVGGSSSEVRLTACREPRTNLPRALDPYASVDEPDDSGPCDNLGGTETSVSNPSGVRKFCGGLNLNDDYVFEPGVYIIDGGDFRINSNATVSGDGVTFYFTGGAEANFNGNATIDITAPSTGEYAGIAFFGDRDDTSTTHKFNGTADSLITGAMYFAGGSIEFLGDFSGQNGCMQIVGRTVHIGGNTAIETDCTGSGINWARVPGDVRLVE